MQFTIKQARQYAGLSQAQVAEAIGVCRHRYMKIEKDVRYATVAELQKISRITRCHIHIILKNEGAEVSE